MYKSKLKELCQKKSWGLPEYSTAREGLDHNPCFTATVTINGVPFQTTDQSRNVKEAQNKAAKLALDHFSSDLSPNTSPKQPSPSSALSGDMLYLYKNRLQRYAQKSNLTLPEYSTERDGPPHDSRFKSKVTMDGKTYESPHFFPTIREAEHAAAKVALESLSIDEVQEDDSGLYKNLLQELAQKEDFHIPKYVTMNSGPPHMPSFVSTVEIGGQYFEGKAARSKKQAETNAAKIAYTGLQEPKDYVSSAGNEEKLSPKLTPANAEFSTHHAPTPPPDADIDTKQPRCLPSSRDSVYSSLRDQLSFSSSSSESEHSECSNNSSMVSTNEPPVGAGATNIVPREEILVYPRTPNMKLPEAATVLPFSDEKWVALKVNSTC
ncbi:Double-stranded RNA-binding protein [Actinidia chinensis var. chinensis]|uniref:Double-stranded RNA-binding protein n=1 Tax=Actinidia chinensis var. chinensis TaxID=1590841 RepID=A0A2R6QVP6_ACTCC|nr:Double-stranded RNA-binding protein [Actinidia chinensis var. chinensis]